MFEDSEGALAKAFLYGLDANAAGSVAGEDVAWQACEAIVDEFAVGVVREAEADARRLSRVEDVGRLSSARLRSGSQSSTSWMARSQ